MNTKNNLTTYTKYLIVTASLVAIPLFSFNVKAADAPTCPDTIVHCYCSNGNQVCNHQLSDCTVPAEIHNEMPGAAACGASATSTPSPTPTPTATSSASLEIGVGGGPVNSSPTVVSSQSNNQAGELPKTGLPIGAIALIGLAPLGFKLKSFTSRFGGQSDPNLIWTGKQLKK